MPHPPRGRRARSGRAIAVAAALLVVGLVPAGGGVSAVAATAPAPSTATAATPPAAVAAPDPAALGLTPPVPAATPATGSGSYVLCTGYSGCAAAGYSDAGYAPVSGTSYWGMYPGHNCTNYGAYRLIQAGIDASYLRGNGNAYEWAGQAQLHGVLVDHTPSVGAIAWWDAYAPGVSSGGHVAYVEAVGAGSITTSEDNYGGDFHWRHLEPTGYYPTAFIHFGRPVPTDTRVQLRATAGPGPADFSYRYGGPNATILSCDVNGDGRPDVLAYVAGTWYVRTSPTPGPAQLTFTYGGPGMVPVCGSWDGGAAAGIGVFDGTTWWLRSTASAGAPDRKFSYGWPGTVPVVGRWTGAAAAGIGVWDPATGTWWQRDTATPGDPARVVQYGFRGATPVPADWDGNGTTDLGIFDGGTWYLRKGVAPGAPDAQFGYGVAGDAPVAAPWNGGAAAGVGVTRPE